MLVIVKLHYSYHSILFYGMNKKKLVFYTTVPLLITIHHVLNFDVIKGMWKSELRKRCSYNYSLIWLPLLMRLMTCLCHATNTRLAPPLHTCIP